MIRCSFEPTHYSQGRSRKAYRGVVTAHPQPGLIGKRVVAKKPIDGSYSTALSEMDLRVARKAQVFAAQFNKDFPGAPPIDFQLPVRMIADDGQSILVEWFLYGEYTNWIYNNGTINQAKVRGNELMLAFAHWTWVKSGEQFLVCDLQGVKDPRGYHLTDPAIHSLTGQYGTTDLGQRGIDLFFRTHVCNSACRSLGVQNNTPKPTTQNLEALLSLIGNQLGTSYEGELLRQIQQTGGMQWRNPLAQRLPWSLPLRSPWNVPLRGYPQWGPWSLRGYSQWRPRSLPTRGYLHRMMRRPYQCAQIPRGMTTERAISVLLSTMDPTLYNRRIY